MIEQTIIGRTPTISIEEARPRIVQTAITDFVIKPEIFFEYLEEIDGELYSITSRVGYKDTDYPIIGELVRYHLHG